MRKAEIVRKTKETDISVWLCIDGKGKYLIDTGCGFLNHMLELFTSHGRFDLEVKCSGDTEVDYHHTVEDIGIAIGTAFKEALGNKEGIARYGSMNLPMDEALVQSVLDFSGRSCLCYNVDIPATTVGDFDTELTEEFLTGFVRASEMTLHINMFSGRNSHHIIEAIFKSLARAIRTAVSLDNAYAGEIPSTKGTL